MADPQFEDDELNIGWLDAQHPFPIYEGPAPRWVEQLEEYVLAHLCTVTRGVHSCEFCPPGSRSPSASREVVIGSAEIAVQGTSVVYRAPSLVAHYCRAHRYQPPEDFVNAVSRGDRSVPVPTDKRRPVRIDDFRGPVNIDVIARELREGFLASVRAPDYIRFDLRQAGDSVHVSAETFFSPTLVTRAWTVPNELLINQRQATFALRSMIGSAYTNFANESFFVEMARRRVMRGR